MVEMLNPNLIEMVNPNLTMTFPNIQKSFMVKMVNPNLIMTISKFPDFLMMKLLKFIEIVETSVNFDHFTMTI
jgi:hypothetical protein